MNVDRLPRRLSADAADTVVGSYVDELADDWTIISDEVALYDDDTDEPIGIYARYPGDVAELRRAVLDIPWNWTYRATSGIKNRSKTFGMAPKTSMLQRESCRPTALYFERPDIHETLETSATVVDRWTREVAPDIRAADIDTVGDVLPEWRIGDDTIWTSGVVNLTSQMPYHRDGSNFQSWSAMPVIRRGTRGGLLALPEYRMAFACRDGWMCYFPGWRLVHGVTPIRKVADDGYRITIVYYSLRGMKDCATFAREVSRGQAQRSAREDTMLRGGNEFDPVR